MSQQWPYDGPGPLENTPESDLPSLSPRSILLSPVPFENPGLDEPPNPISRGPSLKFRHQRERAHSTASPRHLVHLLVNEEYEVKQTRKVLYTVFARFEHQARRADAAEARIKETIERAKSINEARIAAQQDAIRAQEELKLYRLQLENAQREITRAQDILTAIEAQRDEAEIAAADARSRARRLNEERLIELAREQGRRLGFEEGIRRGRTMGFGEGLSSGLNHERSEMRDAAATALDRLLEDREDTDEQVEIPANPVPVPIPSVSRVAPEVHRVETSSRSSLENQRHNSRSRRDSSDSVSRASTVRCVPNSVVLPATSMLDSRIVPPPGTTTSVPTASSQASRSRQEPQPWPAPPTEPPFSRPVSVQNSAPSVHNGEIHAPPDGYIPVADGNHAISLLPPYKLNRNIPSPTPSQQTTGPPPQRVRSRDHIYDNVSMPRRGSPDGSLASTKQSAASTISQLEIVGLPSGSKRRDHSQGLSVIHEDASMRSERMTDYSQTVASTSQAGRHSFRERESSETLRRDRNAKQQLADNLRYSDPMEAEEWRRYGAERTQSQASNNGPPRPRPSHVTVPSPLSPPRVVQQMDPSRHRRARSMSERQGRESMIDDRRPLSSDSSVPEISVEPPSGPPSDAPSRERGQIPASDLLSPDHANRPLPVPAPNGRGAPLVPTVPNSPVIPRMSLAGQFYSVPPDGQFPPSFLPSRSATGSAQAPMMPQTTGSGVAPQRYASPYGQPPERESGRPKSPNIVYAASPVPSGVTYPAPPISRSATYNANPSSQDAGGPSSAVDDRRRRNSLSSTAGMTPAARAKPLQPSAGSSDGGANGVRDSHVPRQQSNASLGSQPSRSSYSRYNPSVYNDPAYLASNDSLMDSVTDVNTAANAGGGPVRPARRTASPTYSYNR
ncbi:hypothetical protein PAXRUDRAFT_32708 [Paxillus rubicundulus Ve08.2h10]|uniref:Uncharacterized protein n=1 Tax=Paxillus rubicundulus Ve08.2h10 TaxID=930991 RepID=A0A0D0DEK8_9AGAM|nr:hypothetical protein PAXRUDRAFT_32708 [Paxillus rubicundulus Ve08.2h10]